MLVGYLGERMYVSMWRMTERLMGTWLDHTGDCENFDLSSEWQGEFWMEEWHDLTHIYCYVDNRIQKGMGRNGYLLRAIAEIQTRGCINHVSGSCLMFSHLPYTYRPHTPHSAQAEYAWLTHVYVSCLPHCPTSSGRLSLPGRAFQTQTNQSGAHTPTAPLLGSHTLGHCSLF